MQSGKHGNLALIKAAHRAGHGFHLLVQDKLDQLAAIKTREELIGDIIGLLQSPIRRVVSALQTVAEDQAEDVLIKSLAKVKAAPAEAPAAE